MARAGGGVWVCLVCLALACAPSGPERAPGWLTQKTPASHDADFPIASGPHAGVACERCHGAFDSFTEFSCTGCHQHERAATDGIHQGAVQAYAYEPKRCFTCHPRGTAGDATPDLDHEQRFPIATGTAHALARCADCHPDRTRRQEVSCQGCHTRLETAPRHPLAPAYVWESKACLVCHPRARVPRTVEHPAFPIAAGTKHGEVRCSSCHLGPADWRAFDCTGCHQHAREGTDAAHGRVPAYDYAPKACYACHPAAAAPRLPPP